MKRQRVIKNWSNLWSVNCGMDLHHWVSTCEIQLKNKSIHAWIPASREQVTIYLWSQAKETMDQEEPTSELLEWCGGFLSTWDKFLWSSVESTSFNSGVYPRQCQSLGDRDCHMSLSKENVLQLNYNMKTTLSVNLHTYHAGQNCLRISMGERQNLDIESGVRKRVLITCCKEFTVNAGHFILWREANISFGYLLHCLAILGNNSHEFPGHLNPDWGGSISRAKIYFSQREQLNYAQIVIHRRILGLAFEHYWNSSSITFELSKINLHAS